MLGKNVTYGNRLSMSRDTCVTSSDCLKGALIKNLHKPSSSSPPSVYLQYFRLISFSDTSSIITNEKNFIVNKIDGCYSKHFTSTHQKPERNFKNSKTTEIAQQLLNHIFQPIQSFIKVYNFTFNKSLNVFLEPAAPMLISIVD